jgi:hypothetical protein
MAKVFPPETTLEFLNLPFSVKENARKAIQQNQEIAQQIEAAKAIKPPTLSASLSDIDKLPPEGAAQLAAKFGIQLDPNEMDDGERKSAMEVGSKILDMRMKQEEHQLKLAQSGEKHKMDIDTKRLKALNDMDIRRAQKEENEEAM